MKIIEVAYEAEARELVNIFGADFLRQTVLQDLERLRETEQFFDDLALLYSPLSEEEQTNLEILSERIAKWRKTYRDRLARIGRATKLGGKN